MISSTLDSRVSQEELLAFWKKQDSSAEIELFWLESNADSKSKNANTPAYDPTVSIVCMWGLGQDSFNGILRLIQQLKAQGYPLKKLCVLVSMTGLEWSYSAGYLNELFFLPILAQEEIRLLQIIKAGPTVADKYTILDDSRNPRKLWLYGRATPPLSPMSENIEYDVSGLYSPLHPLWSPDAVWDLNYRPENFGPPDPYVDQDLNTNFENSIFTVERSHRHHVCSLINSTASTYPCREAIARSRDGMGGYYLAQGTLPQFRSTRRDCSEKFKGIVSETAVEDIWSLGQQLLQVGGIPQYAADGRVCSNRFKQEGSGQIIDDEFGGEHSLAKDLLTGGVVPQARSSEGRGKCSSKLKQIPSNAWVEDAAIVSVREDLSVDLATISDEELIHLEIAAEPTEWRSVQIDRDKIKLEFNVRDPYKAVALPPYVTVCIFFNDDEENRRKRGEFAVFEKQKNRKQPLKPKVYRLMRYPLQEYGVGRKQLERENQLFCQEPHSRSACSICCFAGICGTDQEVFSKHRRMPNESGFACLIELNARILNSKQTTFPGSRGLIEMVQQDGNWEALLNLQARLDALPWAIYRVQRLTGGTPYRNTQILKLGSRQELEAQFSSICQQHNAYLCCDTVDGLNRGWIEYREYSTQKLNKNNQWDEIRHTVQDLIVLCPALPIEKRRSGWHRAWAEAHQTQMEIVAVQTNPPEKRRTRKPRSP